MTKIDGMWNELYLSCPNCNEDAVRMDLVWDTEEVYIHNNGNGTAIDVQGEYVCSKCGCHLIYVEYFENGNDASSLMLKSDVALDQLQETSVALVDECEYLEDPSISKPAQTLRDIVMKYKDIKVLTSIDSMDKIQCLEILDEILKKSDYPYKDKSGKKNIKICVDDIKHLLTTEY